jgi:hypothetical protein
MARPSVVMVLVLWTARCVQSSIGRVQVGEHREMTDIASEQA